MRKKSPRIHYQVMTEYIIVFICIFFLVAPALYWLRDFYGSYVARAVSLIALNLP